MASQYIFTIESLSKAHGKKNVLENIWLSFYPGAKIGVLGNNGAGKSTLLRIMAGLDTDFVGTARLTPGFTVGFLSQEPELDPNKDVLGNVEQAVAQTRALLSRFDAINTRLGEEPGPDELDALLTEQGSVQEAIEACNGWELDRQLEIAMDAMRLPPGDSTVKTLSGGERRRVALCALLLRRPDLLLLDEPTNLTPRVSVGSNGICTTTRAPWSPSRTTAIFLTTWLAGSLSSTAVRAFPGRAIIRRGSSKNAIVCSLRRSKRARDARLWNANWSGSAWHRARGSPKIGPAFSAMSKWPLKNRRNATKPLRSKYRLGRI
jgi:ABC-type phosphate/phosphonate transport system ATPase subunit